MSTLTLSVENSIHFPIAISPITAKGARRTPLIRVYKIQIGASSEDMRRKAQVRVK